MGLWLKARQYAALSNNFKAASTWILQSLRTLLMHTKYFMNQLQTYTKTEIIYKLQKVNTPFKLLYNNKNLYIWEMQPMEFMLSSRL